MKTRIAVRQDDFSVADEYAWLSREASAGAVVTFVGKVRDRNLGDEVTGLALEHYPGMTEKALGDICDEAGRRWPLASVSVIHRVGELACGDQIVFVGVSSAHRHASFEACEFIMDYLKTRAPFWKKEQAGGESRWIDSRDSDHQAARRWVDCHSNDCRSNDCRNEK